MLGLRAGPPGGRTTRDGFRPGDFRRGDLGRTGGADDHATPDKRDLGLARGEDLGGRRGPDLGGAQLGVGADDGSADGESDDTTTFFSREETGPRAFLGTTQPTPEIEFEGGGERRALVRAHASVQREVGIEAAFADFDLLRSPGGVDLRQRGALDFTEHRGGLLDPRDGLAEIGIRGEGARHKGVELRIIEGLPPLGADGDAALPCLGISFGRRRRRSLIIRTERATGEQTGEEDQRQRLHGWTTAFSLRPERRWKNQGMKSVATKVSRSMPPSTPVPID